MTGRRGITSTEAVHAGELKNKPFHAVPTPIVQTATYTYESSQEIVDQTSGVHPEPERDEYGRYGNPTCRAVEKHLAALDATEDAALFSSGMAAITTTILALAKQGQHVVLFDDCYRMTREFVTGTLAQFGVAHTLVAAGDVQNLASAFRPETRLVISESPTNPYLRCIDLEALAGVCKSRRGIKTMIDATFATPVNCRPASFGIDLVVHSATKYMGGHHDVLAGVLCANQGLVSLVRDLRGVLGCVCDPHAAFLVSRGLKTLALRVQKQNATGLSVAKWLETRPEIERVYYPGIASHADHLIAQKQMVGFGGVVSFIVKGGLDGAKRVVDHTDIASIGPSFGGTETLIEQPAVMSFYEMTTEQRAAIGIQDGLVRLAVGIEDAEDVMASLGRALVK